MTLLSQRRHRNILGILEKSKKSVETLCKILVPSLEDSDLGPLPPPPRQGFQDSASMLSGEGPAAAAVSAAVPAGLDAPQLHTRVSVGQLRSALLQQTASGVLPDKVYAHLHVHGAPDGPVYPGDDL